MTGRDKRSGIPISVRQNDSAPRPPQIAYFKKLAFPKWSHGLQHKAHLRMLGYSKRDRGTAKKKKIHQAKKISPSKSHKSLFIK